MFVENKAVNKKKTAFTEAATRGVLKNFAKVT